MAGEPTPIPPRILKVRYRSNVGRRYVAECYVKVPYGGLHGMYALVEALTRAMQMRRILWFRIEAPSVITDELRGQLARWPEALGLTSERTGVTWE